MSWNIWISINKYIFKDRRPVSKLIIYNILEQLQAHTVNALPKQNRRLNGLEQEYVYPISFFDGAFVNKIGGTGVHLMISKDYFFFINGMWSEHQHPGRTPYSLGITGLFKNCWATISAH